MDTQTFTEKYKIWDHVGKKWFRPEYPGVNTTKTKEILFSQSGEMYMLEKDADGPLTITYLPTGTKEEPGPYTPCQYTGIKDDHDKKVYMNDEVVFDGQAGYVMWHDCGFVIQLLDDVVPLSEILRFEVTGNILELK